MNINTTPGETYIVLSTSGCNARTKEGKLIKTLAAGQDFFTAMTGDTVLSDDNAAWTVATASMLSLMNTDSNADASQGTIRFEPVTSQSALPATGENGVIYLVPNGASDTNRYTEWVWTGAAYEQLGDAKVDMSGYAKLDANNTFDGRVTFSGTVTAMAALQVNDALTLGSSARLYTANDQGYGRLHRLTVMSTLELSNASEVKLGSQGHINILSGGTAEARLDKLTVMRVLQIPNEGEIRFGDHYGSYYINVDSQGFVRACLSHLSVAYALYFPDAQGLGTLEMGNTGGFINFSDGIIGAKEISVVTGLHMSPEAKIGFSDYGLSSLDNRDSDYIGAVAARGEGRLSRLSVMQSLNLPADISFDGEGWDKLATRIAATAVATIEENDKESFTKLIFPPTGTATAEQDPSWITKKNILMETSGGQLNMTHLTETLAYAAQNRFDIAKRTLWLSTSPGSGDAVQWPANAVFPDDQPQDKIQQLNSNSTYWFDITYVGGSDTVLIRKVCSWASTTGENGPTD